MSDPKIKNPTPEEAFANLEKAAAQFEAATKDIKKVEIDDSYDFDGKLNKKQTEAYYRVLASTATHEAVKLDGIGGRSNSVIENGEYIHNPSSRIRIFANEAWHEIIEKSDKKSGIFFKDGLPDISEVSSKALESVVESREKIIKELSTKPMDEVVAVKVGDSKLNLTVKGFAEVLNNAKQGKKVRDIISPDSMPPAKSPYSDPPIKQMKDTKRIYSV
jgi:hypothetical protein